MTTAHREQDLALDEWSAAFSAHHEVITAFVAVLLAAVIVASLFV